MINNYLHLNYGFPLNLFPIHLSFHNLLGCYLHPISSIPVIHFSCQLFRVSVEHRVVASPYAHNPSLMYLTVGIHLYTQLHFTCRAPYLYKFGMAVDNASTCCVYIQQICTHKTNSSSNMGQVHYRSIYILTLNVISIITYA